MTIDIKNHPCFNAKIKHKFGRVHLPVAPRCNIQCKFCDRKFDCVNESRPGVTSAILTPYQALVYLDHVFEMTDNISVVGIAGPGDPFANPVETMETLRLVRMQYPEIMLCLASNGLGILPYIDELKELNVSHVTITVNAIDEKVASNIYAWVRYNKRILKAEDGVKILMAKQMEAIKKLKEKDITVKVNSIAIPGINDFHIVDIAKKVSEFNVDIFNCIPYFPNAGSAFRDIPEPTPESIKQIRKEAEKYVLQMRHCARCRADAVGCLGDAENELLMTKLQECSKMPKRPDNISPDNILAEESFLSGTKKNIAVASFEGVLVNQHIGQASRLLIFSQQNGEIKFIEERPTPATGNKDLRWEAMAELLSDCHTLLANGTGQKPKQILEAHGIKVLIVEGVIEEAANAIFKGESLNHIFKHELNRSAECSGNGMGCG